MYIKYYLEIFIKFIKYSPSTRIYKTQLLLFTNGANKMFCRCSDTMGHTWEPQTPLILQKKPIRIAE